MCAGVCVWGVCVVCVCVDVCPDHTSLQALREGLAATNQFLGMQLSCAKACGQLLFVVFVGVTQAYIAASSHLRLKLQFLLLTR